VCSRAGEAERTQRQVVTAERRASQRQRPVDVAVDDAHVVATGTGNAALPRVGRAAADEAENVDVVDVD